MLKQILIILLFIGFAGSGGCTETTKKSSSCDTWIINAGKAINVSPAQQFNNGLKQLHIGCDGLIPEPLMNAAGDSLKTADSKERFKVFTNAVAAYYRKACFSIEPGKPAKDLFDFCLEGDYPDGDYAGMLPNLDAAVYLFLKAIEKELKKNMPKSRMNDFYVSKFMQNLFLAAALDYEKQNESTKQIKKSK